MGGLAIRIKLRALILTGFASLLLSGCTNSLKAEGGIEGDLTLPDRTIARAITCNINGTLRSIWLTKLVQGLGGKVDKISVDGGLDNDYLVNLNGKRILVTWEGQPQPIGQADVDAHVVVSGGGFSAGDVQFKNEKTMEILMVAYPTAHLEKQLAFDWNRNLCRWGMAL